MLAAEGSVTTKSARIDQWLKGLSEQMAPFQEELGQMGAVLKEYSETNEISELYVLQVMLSVESGGPW